MTRFDLHPEELIERAERGTLGAADLARLDQHFAECSVCRVEQALRAQAAQDTVPLRDEQLLLARIKRDVTAQLRAPSPRRAATKRAAAGIVVLVASIASAAAAATTFVVLHRQQRVEPLANTTGPRANAAKAVKTAPPVAPAPVVEAPAEQSAVPAANADAPPKAAPPELGSAAETFTRANQARREGQAKEAVRLYRALQERFPTSSEALVSKVALGRLLLDRLGDSRGALLQFSSYLASPAGGALREEALVGRALSLGRLGRSADEKAAWATLLQAAPKSTYAARARARVAELSD